MENNVFIPTENKFREILSDTVDQILSRRIPQIMRQANRKEYMTTAEFEELTGMSYATQKYHRDVHNIEFIQEGRRILYPTEKVEAFMDERRIKSKEVLEK